MLGNDPDHLRSASAGTVSGAGAHTEASAQLEVETGPGSRDAMGWRAAMLWHLTGFLGWLRIQPQQATVPRTG